MDNLDKTIVCMENNYEKNLKCLNAKLLNCKIEFTNY